LQFARRPDLLLFRLFPGDSLADLRKVWCLCVSLTTQAMQSRIASLKRSAAILIAPGMEMPGGAVAPYDVIAFDAAGRSSVFAHR